MFICSARRHSARAPSERNRQAGDGPRQWGRSQIIAAAFVCRPAGRHGAPARSGARSHASRPPAARRSAGARRQVSGQVGGKMASKRRASLPSGPKSGAGRRAPGADAAAAARSSGSGNSLKSRARRPAGSRGKKLVWRTNFLYHYVASARTSHAGLRLWAASRFSSFAPGRLCRPG